MTLLNKAREIKSKGRKGRFYEHPTEESCDLAVAILNGEITYDQAAGALGVFKGSLSQAIPKFIKWGIENGRIAIIRKDLLK